MGMEMRQELRLSQQLVMTPQLQQAIKLLQLSRMELVDMVHEEMLENPILEDDFEVAAEQNKERELLGGDDQVNLQLERAGNTETPLETGRREPQPGRGQGRRHRGQRDRLGELPRQLLERRRRCRPTAATARTCRRSRRR
jgi:DNA-directed RNA polymerase specialized sigma54-like protein